MLFSAILQADGERVSVFDVISNMMGILTDGLLTPFMAIGAVGVGLAILIKAIIDTSKHIGSGGRAQINMIELVASYIIAGALLIVGGIGGIGFIREAADITANTAIGIAEDRYDGNSDVEDGLRGGSSNQGGGGAWDNLPDDPENS